jgi:hypothetical protein
MSEREYPEAWGVYRGDELIGLDYTRADANLTAECENDFDGPVCQIVAMIPAPEVERRIAEAVAEATQQLEFLIGEARNAERERCRQLADKMCDLLAFQDIPGRVYQMIHDQYDAIKSGTEPVEGGAK